MSRFIPLALLAASALVAGRPAEAQLRVVTSTTDLYDIARQVGGTRIRAVHISEGYQDPHFVEAKPSFILQLQRADVFAFVGLDLEIGWMSLLVDGARNPKIRMGGSGYVDVSKAIPVIDVPSGNIDRSQGDVHPLGNPHYWLDPDNAKRIARLFEDKFSELDPAGERTFEANRKSFEARLDAAERSWAAAVAKIKGKPVVAWHTSWRYFAEYTGLKIVGFMEPKPGVPPSPSHLAGLILTMQRTGAKVIVMEPFYDKKTADFVAAKTGATVLVLPPSVGGKKGLDDYLALMQYDISQLAAALQ
ncbi:MAG TPA: metal ABC transporter substrate-binding protein [Gemmatimonadales bacterium]|jgi:ABC-type Zn uptake system ZnuABC Zn-binding protein ZnuA|nr:metal ABC transporter substrate-binding protein [Gemmatimonadales bacterium]HEV8598859.1 metal ABC transporter substrate-binding protein [Gemmatimonadales bacterium]